MSVQIEEIVDRNPLVVIGDRLRPEPYLQNLVSLVKVENDGLDAYQQVRYLLCEDYNDIALALKNYKDLIKMVMVGPGLDGKPDLVPRLLGWTTQVIMVYDQSQKPLASDPQGAEEVLDRLKDIGNILVTPEEATVDFFEPVIQTHVIEGGAPRVSLKDMPPEERAEMLDKRLECVNKLPSLPDTQNKIAALDDMDPPAKWAAAIEPDLLTKKVILRLLNSAHYSFRSRVETIEQAVALASAKAIRNIVLACTMRQLFSKVSEARLDSFWRHSVATGYIAKLLTLPVDPEEQDVQQKSEFERFNLEDKQKELLGALGLWNSFSLGEDDNPFTAGLLHDIGKITMALCFEEILSLIDPIIEEEFNQSKEENKLWARSSLAIEQVLMGDIDHQVIGGRVTQRWDLGCNLWHVISEHHTGLEDSPAIVKLVALADLAANMLFNYPCKEDQHPLSILYQRAKKLVAKSGKEETAEVIDEVIENELASDLEAAFKGLEVSECLWDLIEARSLFKLGYILAPTIARVTGTFLQHTSAS